METNVGASDLSDDLVDQFCAVTGADREIGRQLLEICHGNLEMAIGMHMDQEEASARDHPTPSSSAVPSQSQPHRFHTQDDASSTAAATASVEDEDLNQNGLRAPIPQRHEVLVEEAPKFGFRGRRRAARSVFDGFRDFQAEARQQENMLVTGRSIGKKHTLEDLFRPPIDITFKGTFHAARDRGKSENKWLLVNIQNVQEFSCQVLNRDIWSNFTIKALVKKHFVFWQVYHDSDEGKKFMQFYAVRNWPHVAIVDPVTGENLVTWDKIDHSSFADLLKDFLEDHPTPENPDMPPAKRQKRENSIVDESEEAQIEAAIRASLSQTQQPGSTTANSSTSTISIPSATAVASIIDADSEQSEAESDELETFTGSEEESSDAPTRSSHPRRRGGPASATSQPRSFSALSGQGPTSRSGSMGGVSGVRTQNSASSSSSAAAGAAGGFFPSRLPLPSSLPSTSGSRDFPRMVDDSENENSLGFRESYDNTPNSVDILGGRSWEFQTLDSSSNSSSLVSSSAVTVDNEDDTVGYDKLQQAGNDGEAATAADSAPWRKHFGDDSDPTTNLVVRFPDGKKEQLSLPCSSTLQALFVFCSSKGFAQGSYELVVNFPRRTLSSLDPGSTISEARLHPQETVFVQAR
ncbi:UBX domain-containing protein 7-like [Babylonia areolata]|uniref:UBX domain-containing protein 7-like n=1 Tax=Babylonia areolata TaxID=304850 RepID=UPI003FCF19A8